MALQPSPDRRPPSSHASPGRMMPSPQTVVQSAGLADAEPAGLGRDRCRCSRRRRRDRRRRSPRCRAGDRRRRRSGSCSAAPEQLQPPSIGAGRAAAVAGEEAAVVAGLAGTEQAVAADGGADAGRADAGVARLDLAGGAAAVAASCGRRRHRPRRRHQQPSPQTGRAGARLAAAGPAGLDVCRADCSRRRAGCRRRRSPRCSRGRRRRTPAARRSSRWRRCRRRRGRSRATDRRRRSAGCRGGSAGARRRSCARPAAVVASQPGNAWSSATPRPTQLDSIFFAVGASTHVLAILPPVGSGWVVPVPRQAACSSTVVGDEAALQAFLLALVERVDAEVLALAGRLQDRGLTGHHEGVGREHALRDRHRRGLGRSPARSATARAACALMLGGPNEGGSPSQVVVGRDQRADRCAFCTPGAGGDALQDRLAAEEAAGLLGMTQLLVSLLAAKVDLPHAPC